MHHVALITSSYPDGAPGQEAAGGFVEDFARELSRHARVTVVAASRSNSVTTDEDLMVRRFLVPRLPLSLLNPFRPGDWMPIVRTMAAGRDALEELAIADCPDHMLAFWALPGGYWAESVADQRGPVWSRPLGRRSPRVGPPRGDALRSQPRTR